VRTATTTASLDGLRPGARVVIRNVDGPAPLVRRLAEMGIRPDALVTALHRTAGGGRVVDVAGARIALARSVLRSISTEPSS